MEQYGLFMLYLSQKLTYSEYTAETDIKVLNTVLLCTIALRQNSLRSSNSQVKGRLVQKYYKGFTLSPQ